MSGSPWGKKEKGYTKKYRCRCNMMSYQETDTCEGENTIGINKKIEFSVCIMSDFHCFS